MRNERLKAIFYSFCLASCASPPSVAADERDLPVKEPVKQESSAPIKLARHDEPEEKTDSGSPDLKVPEITVGGKVTSPVKQTDKERYRLPQTTESLSKEKIDATINLATPEDALKYL